MVQKQTNKLENGINVGHGRSQRSTLAGQKDHKEETKSRGAPVGESGEAMPLMMFLNEFCDCSHVYFNVLQKKR